MVVGVVAMATSILDAAVVTTTTTTTATITTTTTTTTYQVSAMGHRPSPTTS